MVGEIGDGAEVRDLQALIDAGVGRRARRHVGLAIGVTLGQGQWVTTGKGRVRSGGATPDSRSNFQIGSVTKVFTALLLSDAVTRGELTLDQPLETLVPETQAHPDGRPIELADLATHTSGLPRLPRGLTRQALRNRQDPYAAFTEEQVIDALARTPKRPPGGRPRYSNFGAGVLGLAVCRATGQDYDDLIRARITEPLHMRDTGIHPSVPDRDLAVGHTSRRRPTVDWHLPSLAGAGAIRSSVHDLLLFLDAHLDPDTTPLAAAIADALTPRARISRPIQVGLGWHILDRPGGARWWWHNGRTGGFASFVGFDPVARCGVAVLSNTSRPVDPIAQRLLDALVARRAA